MAPPSRGQRGVSLLVPPATCNQLVDPQPDARGHEVEVDIEVPPRHCAGRSSYMAVPSEQGRPAAATARRWALSRRCVCLFALAAAAAAGLGGLALLAAVDPQRADLLVVAVVSLCIGYGLARLLHLEPTAEPQIMMVANEPFLTQVSGRQTVEEELKELQEQGRDSQGVLEQYIRPVEESPEEFSEETRVRVLTSKSMAVIRKPAPEADAFLESFGWDLDVCAFAALDGVAGRPICVMGSHLISQEGLVACIPDWFIRDDLSNQQPLVELEGRVQRFFLELDRSYSSVPYHSATHACDVMKNVHCFFNTDFFESLLEIREWTKLICVLAAALHDLGHPGTTNNFHIVQRTELALRYNDKSPLEQMHVASAFELMARKPPADWFSAFRKEAIVDANGKVMPIQARFRRALIAMVLGTDPLVHNEHVEKMRDLADKEESERRHLLFTSSDWQCFALEMALHAADIANPTYAWPVSVEWARRLFTEFWAQGDLEKQTMGSTMIPMFDRDKMDVAAAQSGFINFIALGFWEPLAQLVPEMDEKVNQIRRTLALWEARKAKGLRGFPLLEECHLEEAGTPS